MPAPAAPDDMTGILRRWTEGDASALEELVPLVYAELRRMAARELKRERRNHSLAPTGLVHELYLRLAQQNRGRWQNRAHFLAVAAQLMRRILVEHARARQTLKRGGTTILVPLDAEPQDAAEPSRVADVLAIDAALTRLAAQDADQARLVELRFFAGLTVEEVAQVLSRSTRTIKREWRLARAWLYRELHG